MRVMSRYYCVFCDIVERKAPARIEYEDDDVIVFHNVLDWADVMLLAVPRVHLYQGELWSSDILAKVSRAAVAMGRQHCRNGFRLVSNFGHHAMQSQAHAHIHVVDGKYLHPYPKAPDAVNYEDDQVVVYHNKVQREPVTLLAQHREPLTQSELWTSDAIASVSRVAAELGDRHCANGFRLMTDFGVGPASSPDEDGYLHIIGGTFLGEYA